MIEQSTRRIPSEAGFLNHRNAPRGPRGFFLCRWCGTECAAAQRTFCCPECVHEWKCRTDPGYQAREVEKRDRGICCLCEVDTHAQKAEVTRVFLQTRGDPVALQAFILLATTLRYIGPNWAPRWSMPPKLERRPWDMDHVVPVCEGGGSCGLENLRTLCYVCHHRVTRELAGRRAAEKKSRASTRHPLTSGDEQR